jgi:hypothetical protein
MGKTRDTANLVSANNISVDIVNDYIGMGDPNPSSKLDVNGTVTATDFNSLSDINKKTDISKIINPIEIIKNINGVRFNWKDTNEPSLGVIAQEIEKVLPELISNNKTKTVNYNGIIAVLIEVVKVQQSQIEYLIEQIGIDKK